MASGRVDVTRPFLAICVEHEGWIFEDPSGISSQPSRRDSLPRQRHDWRLVLDCGRRRDEFIESSSPEVDVAPLSAVPTTLSTMDEYDEFVVWWTLTYTSGAGQPVRIEFSTFKGLKDVETSEDISILRRAGLYRAAIAFA